MGKTGMPRRGSMQYWPRKRSQKSYAKVRSWPSVGEGLQGFLGYKAGMTHASIIDNGKHSSTKGQAMSVPVTVLECPPVVVAGAVFYKNSYGGPRQIGQVSAPVGKDLARKITVAKKETAKFEDFSDYDDIKVLIHTQPSLTGIGKKKPEITEMGLGGSNESKLAFCKEHLGKTISVADVLNSGEQLDAHAVTTGKGFQGPVKRFGIQLRESKSEKSVRNPGSLGPWKGQAHIMYRVAHAGQTGYHLRTEYNKWLLKVGTDASEVNPKGGFTHYGLVKNDYILVKGSIPGPKHRMITLSKATRPNDKIPKDAPTIESISVSSQQG